MNSRHVLRQRGFTLIEASLVTVIVGVGVLAIVSAQQAYHQQNDISTRMGTALLLANEMRELTLGLPQHSPISGTATFGPEANETNPTQYDDLDDFAGTNGKGTTITPPMNSLRQTIPNMTGWSQVVTVENVLPNFLNATTPAPQGSTDTLRITCAVLYQPPGAKAPYEVTRLTWVRAGN